MFLLADTSIKVVLKMSFLIFSNANIQYIQKKLTQKFYIIAETLSIIKQVKLIDQKNFTKMALNNKSKTLIVYIATLEALKIVIYHL